MFGSSQAGPFGIIEYRLLTDDKIESAIEIQQKSMRQENVALGVGLYEEEGGPEAMKNVFYEVIKDNCTIVAIDVRTEEVVAVSFNKLHAPLAIGEADPLEEVVKNHVTARSSLALIEFLSDVESRVDLFNRYNTTGAMEIFYVGTDPKYRGFRIGHGVVAASLTLARDLKKRETGECAVIPEVAFGVFTSNYSQRIADILKFEWLEAANYSDYEYWGKTMAERIGNEHKCAKLGALRL
ncbi:uncharacterized protein LOC135168573 [Diachasmimorpha longicaudata]|uniref:uncharacterized protein LOC135168573 n=1 Tax=Diachasmimorpha longicaudata TaxID=58733 RepID=UPI0030B8A870